MRAFSVAQNRMNAAAQPLIVTCDTTELQEFIQSHTCIEQLEVIQHSTSTYICRDLTAMDIKVYGTEDNQMKAEEMGIGKAKELFSGGAKIIEVELGASGQPPGLMKCLVARYGYDLEGMLKIDGIRRVTLNPRRQLMSLLTTTDGLDSVQKYIDEYSKRSQVTVRKMKSEYEVECSVCFTPVENPKALIRLECCGHAFHTECIAVQLNPNTLKPPIQCAKEGCSLEFLLRDFENLQKRLKFRMTDMVSAALRDYIEKNGDGYKNCPTPDCKMIYVISDVGKPFICSNCGIKTCTKCHEQYHTGLSCEMYRSGKGKDEKLEEWMQEDPQNRKRCPKCTSPIEKNEGCNHVHCLKCKAHICWLCLKYFKKSGQCYEHQPYCPANQGIGAGNRA